MHANLLAQSEHVSGAELRAKGAFVGTIKSIVLTDMDNIDPNKPGKRPKGVFAFEESGSKPWVTNKTNVEILKRVFGDGRCGKEGTAKEHTDGRCYQTEHWHGHKIALGSSAQKVSGEPVDGIAVIGCSALTAPLEVEVKLPKRAPRKYTVNPPNKPATTGAAT